jgi:hypothetical protein
MFRAATGLVRCFALLVALVVLGSMGTELASGTHADDACSADCVACACCSCHESCATPHDVPVPLADRSVELLTGEVATYSFRIASDIFRPPIV